MKVQTLIIGAGISGLSTAHFLSKKNSDFIVIESDKSVGGVISTKIKSGFICENGPNTVLINNDAIKELLNDYNLGESIIYPSKLAEKNRFVIKNGKAVALPSHPIQIFTTNLLSSYDKLKILLEPFKKKHHKNTSVKSFFDHRFGVNFTNTFVVPFTTGIYAGNIEKMSMRHALSKVWKLEQDFGSVLKGLIKSRKSSSQKNQIFSLKKGLSDLNNKIYNRIQKNILLDTRVKSIKKNDSGYVVETNRQTIKCTKIVSTIPAFCLSELIEDDDLIQQLNNIEYVPANVLHFGFEKKSIKNPLNGFGVLTKPSDNKSFLGILFNSQIFEHVSPKDKNLYTVIVGGDRQKELCELPKKELESIILKELTDFIKTDSEPIFKNHYVYKKGIPQYRMKHQELVKSIERFQSNNPNFYISGNYINGVSVSDCIKNAKKLNNNL